MENSEPQTKLNPDRCNSVDILVHDFVDLSSQKLEKADIHAGNAEENIEEIRRAKSEYREAEAVVIGAATSAVCIGIECADLPHVIAGIGEMWNAVIASMKS